MAFETNKSINIKFPFQLSDKGFFLETTKTTQDAIRANLMHLILTQKGQRLYLPSFGTNLYKFIFEPSDSLTASGIRREIEDAVARFIPNLQIKGVVIDFPEDHKANVTIDYIVNEDALIANDRIVIEILK